ncbi:MAG: Protein YciN [Candidatus Erwinia impunctatus]|nr:Protein YciN [Culicoides impunctatus]
MQEKQQQQLIDSVALLKLANEMIVEHQQYLPGMQATSVEQRDDVLIFKGEYFLDADGLPTADTTAVFNVFKALAVALSPHYRLSE